MAGPNGTVARAHTGPLGGKARRKTNELRKNTGARLGRRGSSKERGARTRQCSPRGGEGGSRGRVLGAVAAGRGVERPAPPCRRRRRAREKYIEGKARHGESSKGGGREGPGKRSTPDERTDVTPLTLPHPLLQLQDSGPRLLQNLRHVGHFVVLRGVNPAHEAGGEKGQPAPKHPHVKGAGPSEPGNPGSRAIARTDR